jgi:hypothetical protein
MEHEDVVQVNDKVLLVDKVREDGVHKGLESGRGIAEAKGHDEGFEETKGAFKGSFPFIAFFNVDVVITPVNIKFGKIMGTLEFIDEVRDQGQRCGILNGNII